MVAETPTSYAAFLNRETRVSSLLAYLPGAQAPSFEALAKGFAQLGIDAKAISVRTVPNELDVIQADLDDVGRVLIRRLKAPYIENHVRETMKLEKEVVAALDDSRWVLLIQLPFSPMPIADLSDQIRFAHALAPNLLALLDVNAQKMRSRAWVNEVATARVPPAPSALFTIHALDSKTGFWLHTHGLDRCMGAELELHDVPAAMVERAGALLNLIAPRLIEDRPKPGVAFAASERVKLCWLPWEHARAKATNAPREADHRSPGLVLLTEALQPAHEALEAFNQSRTFTSSNMATARDRLLAQDGFATFATLHATHANEAGWQFEVKLPFKAKGGGGEFVWCRFESLEVDRLDATLLAEPMYADSAKQGDRVQRKTSEVTDWAIVSPHGNVRPAGLEAFVQKLRA